jgi:hypothetical protein
LTRIRRIGPLSSTVYLGQNSNWDSLNRRWVPGTRPNTTVYNNSVCYDVVNPGPPYRQGGALTVIKTFDTLNGSSVSQARSYGNDTTLIYSGLVVPLGAFSMSTALLPGYTGSEYGAEAWNKARPGKPGVDLAQAIAELKDLPSTVRGIRDMFRDAVSNAPRAAGSAHLTWSFGIAPMISDLQNLYSTYKNQEAILKQIARDNGRGIRRRRKLVSVSKSTTSNHTSFMGTLPSLTYVGTPLSSTISTYKKDVWFSGRFRYYIPDVGSVAWRRRAIANLYGLKPNVRLLWELTPWSWLIDWFANVGDALGNLQDDLAENLAADYAYMMATVQEQQTYMYSGTVRLLNGSTSSFSCSKTRTRVSKSRTVASPFGFGLNSDGLSDRQMLILGALGLSRTPR